MQPVPTPMLALSQPEHPTMCISWNHEGPQDRHDPRGIVVRAVHRQTCETACWVQCKLRSLNSNGSKLTPQRVHLQAKRAKPPLQRCTQTGTGTGQCVYARSCWKCRVPRHPCRRREPSGGGRGHTQTWHEPPTYTHSGHWVASPAEKTLQGPRPMHADGDGCRRFKTICLRPYAQKRLIAAHSVLHRRPDATTCGKARRRQGGLVKRGTGRPDSARKETQGQVRGCNTSDAAGAQAHAPTRSCLTITRSVSRHGTNRARMTTQEEGGKPEKM